MNGVLLALTLAMFGAILALAPADGAPAILLALPLSALAGLAIFKFETDRRAKRAGRPICERCDGGGHGANRLYDLAGDFSQQEGSPPLRAAFGVLSIAGTLVISGT